jgi:perosamine synthetase
MKVRRRRALWTGRVALDVVLRALGVDPGDRVALCAFTCVRVVETVTRLSAIPAFLDVDRRLNIAAPALERLDTPPAALVLQYAFGVPSGVETCLAWAAARHSVGGRLLPRAGATWNGRRVGSFCCAAVFSFEWSKPFSTGPSGMLTFPQANLAREVDRVSAHEGVAPGFRESAALGLQRVLDR